MGRLPWLVAALAVGYVLFRAYNNFDPESLRGARVLITGGSSGIGEQLAYQYAKLGAKVVITARRENLLKKVTAKMQDLGASKAVYVAGDMGKAEDCETTIQTVEKELGGLDYLILNHAGSSFVKDDFYRLWGSDPDMDFLTDFTNINYLSYVRLTSLALPMLKKNGANIVVSSSIGGKMPAVSASYYCGAKFALDGFFSSLRLELEPHNVSVTLVILGSIKTDLFSLVLASKNVKQTYKTMFGYLVASPEDAATSILEGAALRKREIYYPAYTMVLTVLRAFIPSFLEML